MTEPDGALCQIVIEREDGLGADNPRFVVNGEDRRWLVPSDGLEGFGGVEYSVTTEEYAQYDGAYLLAERVPARDRTITAEAQFGRAEARDEARAFFIPRREYVVHCTYLGRTTRAVGRQYAFDLSTDNVWGRQTLTWTFLALDPFWASEADRSFDLAEATPRRGFPFCSYATRVAPEPAAAAARAAAPVERHVAGFVVGVLSRKIPMTNAGDVTAYPRFEVTASGDVAKPLLTIYDSAGAEVSHVGLDLTLRAGDRLVIDFSARPTSVELNGQNVANRITVGSALATGIEVGDFSLGWSAESGDAALSVRPSIRERYTSA